METSSPSVIVLDSDSDSEGAPTRHGKRKSSVITSVGSVKQPNGNGAPQPQQHPQSPNACNAQVTSGEPARKRIKPITVATNLSVRESPNGLHNSNNNNSRASVESPGPQENFAQITFSEDWEQEMKQYQRELNGQSRKRPAPSDATTVVVLDDPPDVAASPTRSSTTSTTINDEPERIDGRPLKVKQQATAAVKVDKNPIGPEFQQLLDACRKADPSKEMELLIQKRLIRYYEIVHPDYVNSKSFKKAVAATVIDVQTHPNLVFLKLSGIVEELNARRKSRAIIEPALATTASTTTTTSTTNGGGTPDGKDGSPTGQSNTTGKDARKDQQIARLNRTLYCLKKRIQMLEEAEVDFNHDANSAYMMVQRYKKRAFDVYKKLCDITGESKDAHRLVKKPIHFQGTPYTEFNRTIQLFVNRTDSFPDFRDVLKCLQHCDEKYGYNLRREQMDRVAQDAFLQVGKLLQKRRKTDLYETVSYYANDATDPALADQKLQEKLDQNRKYYNKVGELIDKFAKAEANNEIEMFEDLPLPEDYPAAVLAKAAVDEGDVKESKTEQMQPSNSSSSSSSAPSSSSSGSTSSSSSSSSSSNNNSGIDKKDTSSNRTTSVSATDDSAKVLNADVTDDSEDDEDDDEDEEDEEDEEEDDEEQTTKENVKPDCFEDIVISDDEELLLPES
ncbi:daxx-like protein [Anopheles albimanus]|uniref:Daxx histone-binding domain-containing protein n=1 Tax=Anopheles albimanus TaxID=7167 RepID=A0A182G0G7_ANOAL|nr:daxx-like protein [Anopheles albimanus]